MTQDEIIRMAREASVIGGFDDVHPSIERFAALVAAHEREKQAEQKPVAYYVKFGRRVNDNMQVVFDDDEILYAAPVRTKDLTDDEIVEALGYDKSYRLKRWVLDDARAVIAADREKNK